MAVKPTPGKVVDTKEYKELGIIEWTLSNGSKVVLKPTDFKNDEVMFNAYSPGGTSVVSDKEYVSAASADDISTKQVFPIQSNRIGKNAFRKIS